MEDLKPLLKPLLTFMIHENRKTDLGSIRKSTKSNSIVV